MEPLFSHLAFLAAAGVVAVGAGALRHVARTARFELFRAPPWEGELHAHAARRAAKTAPH